MANRSSTLRQPPRTATPEELAEENRRAEEARDAMPERSFFPAADRELADAVLALIEQGEQSELLGHLQAGEFVPSKPAEVAAVLKLLSLEETFDSDRFTNLLDRVDVMQELLEKLVTAVLTPERRTEEDLAAILQLKAITHIWGSRESQARELRGMMLRTRHLNELWESEDGSWKRRLKRDDTYDNELRSGNWPAGRDGA